MVNSQTKTRTSSSIVIRPPVVAVLGHVDHGKTTLLDYIRHSQVASGESGGITQHIGAYRAKIKIGTKKEEIITFIDTPGHAAFRKLRSRGVRVADIAVLVVDATAGVKPQTIESIKYIKEAEIPFLVAINKMDLAPASAEMVKTQLAEKGVLVEGWGGDIVSVPISAKTGKGVDELLEMILLVNQMQEIKADLRAKPQGVIIEAKLDSRRGPIVTLLVKNGVFRIGGWIVAAEPGGKITSSAKIKAMFDENGKKISQATPSQPVQVLGFKTVPQIGVLVKIKDGKSVTLSETEATENTENFSYLKPVQNFSVAEETSMTNQTKLLANTNNIKKIKIILKADVTGSLEAIRDSLPEEILLILEGIGDVTGSDVLLAKSTQSLILAFRVKVGTGIKKLAAFEKVTIKEYDIIYRLLEDLATQALRILEPKTQEQILGEAEVIAEFKIKGNHIAGCQVKKGIFDKKEMVHIKRADKLIATTRIKSLQIKRQDVQRAKEGEEVGLVFTRDVDFTKGDAIISYNKNDYTREH